MSSCTVFDLIGNWARSAPESVALLAPGRAPLTYERLLRQMEYAVQRLNELGIGRGDRVAIVLPNGPEMAMAFLSTASGAVAAPLNPAYRAAEFDFYLADLNARALITLSGRESPAVEVARSRGIEVIDLVPSAEGPAGVFSLDGNAREPIARTGFAEPEDVALVLHTSGTTSRPKMVPLTQTNICTSAHNIRTSLALAPADRCLSVMPLFHIHGLIGALLSSLSAGASTVCTPGFDQSRFFGWMDEFSPTWYTAVPTMHQAVLASAPANQEVVARRPLRLIRSCSAALPPRTMLEMESAFNVPVMESYGMTEASHQMASNPLPPRDRKPGSVGVAAGPEVAIMDAEGNLLLPGSTGEIVIRGANVTRGYEANPTANDAAFTNGWFRTGDQGVMDGDGYLFITGRLKEMILRGGENIAPREVDEVLISHPAVREAVTFAVPHPSLGEDVAAAVVLRDAAHATEQEVREHAAAHLAQHKVPSRVLFLDQLPKGPTGKLQRIGLAERLADELRPPFTAPRGWIEDTLAIIFAEALDLEKVGVRDNFFLIGGDSLRATRVISGVRAAFQTELPLSALFQAPTVEELALLLGKKGWPMPRESMVLLQGGASRPPLFCLPAAMGNVFASLGHLVHHLGSDQPVYGLQEGPDTPFGVEALASHYLREVRSVQPEGPYFLGGVCSGGVVAYEMAQQLRSQGQQVALLAMMEPVPPARPGLAPYVWLVGVVLDRLSRRVMHHVRDASRLDSSEARLYARLRVKFIASQLASRRYLPKSYPGVVHLFLTRESIDVRQNSRKGWIELAGERAEVYEIPGTHRTVTGKGDTPVEETGMRILAEELRGCMDRALLETRR